MYIRSREVRSLISKIRGGTDRLRVEEGRWSRIERSEHLCQHCESQEVEDSNHFILRCEKISNERSSLFEELVLLQASVNATISFSLCSLLSNSATLSLKIEFLILKMWKRRNYVG